MARDWSDPFIEAKANPAIKNKKPETLRILRPHVLARLAEPEFIALWESMLTKRKCGCITTPHKLSETGIARLQIAKESAIPAGQVALILAGKMPDPENGLVRAMRIKECRYGSACVNPDHLFWGTRSQHTYYWRGNPRD